MRALWASAPGARERTLTSALWLRRPQGRIEADVVACAQRLEQPLRAARSVEACYAAVDLERARKSNL